MNDAETVAGRLDAVRERIAKVAARAGRPEGSVRLLAVSKTKSEAQIREAYAAGQRDFGENRVQEAQRKWPGLRAAYPGIRLHLIGPLQTNKVRDAVASFDAVHSVDREKLAAQLARDGELVDGSTWQLKRC